jgi:hypothetical protein
MFNNPWDRRPKAGDSFYGSKAWEPGDGKPMSSEIELAFVSQPPRGKSKERNKRGIRFGTVTTRVARYEGVLHKPSCEKIIELRKPERMRVCTCGGKVK